MNIGSYLEQIILPPGGFIFLSLAGLVLASKARRLGYLMTVTGLILLWISSLPVTANILMSWLEPGSALTEKSLTKPVPVDAEFINPPQAIVILAGGRHYDTLEFESDTPDGNTLERIRYGVWLARRTLLPVLVSGGLGDDNILTEAVMMKQLIENEYALPVRWAETKSRNTYENARYSTELLKADGIESIYLVTHASHMKRSVMSFEKFGLTVHSAPTAFSSTSQRGIDLHSFLPDAKALHRTTRVFHEWVGMVWYWLRY